jgi:long-chain acyl-CoA synthetase
MKLPYTYPTVVHMLLEAVEHAPDREALVCDGERLTYADYLRCVGGLANELHEMGAAGERVVIILGNSLDICIAFFAAHLARAQVTPLNPMYTDRELRPMLMDAGPRVLIYDEAQHDRDGRLVAELNIPHAIRIGAGPGSRRLIRPDQWRNTRLPPDLPLPEDLGTLQFTGGTTGRAKGANLTHAATSINIAQREVIFPMRDDVERCLCVMPLFHCYASHTNLHAMALHRGTLVVQKRYHPADVLETLARERITLFGGSPTLFAGLMNFPGFTQADFSLLNLSCSGGSPLPAEMLARWEDQTRTPIIEGYGQTEAGPVISFNPVHGVRKPGSVGVAVGQTELQIVDVETGTRVLPSGEKGEIRLRGPQLMRDYRNLPEETAQVLRNGWLHTGDVGELDADGYLFIRGRKKEMIIVSGYNVFPREVEEVLHGNPSVREAAVVGRPDAYRGELPVAFVVARDGATLDAAELGTFCADRLAKYKIPAEFQIVEALPKTAVGKIDKLTLAVMARGKGE